MGARTLRAGVGLLVLSLVLAVALPRLVFTGSSETYPTEVHLFVYAVVGWAQQAALVLGAVLVGAAVVLRRLDPGDAVHGRPESGVDWYDA